MAGVGVHLGRDAESLLALIQARCLRGLDANVQRLEVMGFIQRNVLVGEGSRSGWRRNGFGIGFGRRQQAGLFTEEVKRRVFLFFTTACIEQAGDAIGAQRQDVSLLEVFAAFRQRR